MHIILGLIVAGGILLLLLVAPVISWMRAARMSADLRRLSGRLGAVEAQLRDLSARAAAGQPAAVPRGAAATPESPPVQDTAVPAAEDAAPATAVPEPAPTTPFEPVAAPALAVGDGGPATAVAGEPAEPVPQPPARPVVAAPAATDDTGGWLEVAIGGRLLLYVGTVALVLGVAFFLKYAFDRNWITEWMRVTLGAVGGLALVGAGLRFDRSGYGAYGQMLAGGGLGVLFLAVYAAFDFYGLIGRTTAFALFVAITAAAAFLADRLRSQPMAVMAVGAGFLTPFLVGGDTDAQVTLFTYDALLVGGTMVLAHRRGWPTLNVLSYGLTVLTITAWASEYYSRMAYLRTELFLTLFCAMFLYIRARVRRSESMGAGVALVVLASAPLLYHFASIGILFNRSVALLVYLIGFSLVGVWWSIRANRSTLRLLLWLAVMLPLLGWMADHQRWTWVVPSLVTIGAVFTLHLVALYDRLFRLEASLSPVDLLLLHVNGLGAFFATWVLLEPMALAWVPVAGFVLALLHVAVAWHLRPRDVTAALHALAVGFSLVAAAVAVELDGTWLTAAWAAEGAAVAWVGLRVRRSWFRGAGAVLLTVAIGRWLGLHLPDTAADFHAFRNEAFLLGAWIVALLYVLAWLHTRTEPRAAAHHESVAALLVSASVVTVLLLTAESTKYWTEQGAQLSDATFARGLTVSLVWAFYAAVLIVIGIMRRYAPIRYVAIALFGLTIGKVFLVDLAGLEGIYRVVGLMIVGAVLLTVSFLYQRVVKAEQPGQGEGGAQQG
jgi:uncharacterized membrane protein